ncbi:MAG: class III extradiol ring-cleavage dioxygenase [Nitrosomonadales bacterium]|nr:class III extradiol ring-cleavage dioxygenase [Nitrosomonadales bacterium]
MNATRFPTFFLSHGGGPWPYIDGVRDQYAITKAAFRNLPQTLPSKPKAVLVITGHWEERIFTVSTAEHPPMVYDYHGFPEHTYHIQYVAPGSPTLATRVRELLQQAGIPCAENPNHGYDHGTFVPLGLMYPDAEVPVVMLSMKANYNVDEHIAVGQAIQALRDEEVLIIGSGLTYHNMRGFGQAGAMQVSVTFEQYLHEAVTEPNETIRLEKLKHWEQSAAARQAHPQEDHLMPLMVVAGAAGKDMGERFVFDNVMNVAMASYRFG